MYVSYSGRLESMMVAL